MIDEFFAYREPAAVGVSFRRSGKIYYFAPGGLRVRQGDQVLANTEKGIDVGEVVLIKYEPEDAEQSNKLKPLLRKATAEDLAHEKELQIKEREARKLAEQKVLEHKLPMRLIAADYTFDGQRLVFFFSAEGRVDFRDLVRDLAEMFHTRIELRQVGVRDQAKMVGGLGPCGRPLCCNAFLRNFDPVGIRVAKDQGLSLNPAKISGICDRLMCCLRYEHESYQELARKLPRVGQLVQTRKGPGEVRQVNLMHERLTIRYPNDETETLKASEVFRMDEEIPELEVADEDELPEEEPEMTRPIMRERQPRTRPQRQRPEPAPRRRQEPARPEAPAPGRQEERPTEAPQGEAPAEKSRRRRRRRSDRKPAAQGDAAATPARRDENAPRPPIQPFRPPAVPTTPRSARPKPEQPQPQQGDQAAGDRPAGERPARKRRPRFRSRPKGDSNPPASGS
ncbi:MAG: regulatory iron-sulfur-containing complex subunit RicT [Armatimonadia bacterium]